MGHPSNRTLVRVLRLGGAKRRFILAAARHRGGDCEAQKRPAGPIVSRSLHPFVFNDVVGLDLFFLNTYEKHTLPATNIVCWGTGLQRVIPLRGQLGETLRNVYRNNWLRFYGRPRILVVDQQRSLCSGIFAEKVESGGTRLEVTPLEAPWRNGKTERAGKDWKEDNYKMTQDGPEARTWTDFEEDCDAVDQARASKNQRQRVQRVPTCFRQESSSNGRCCFAMWRSRPRHSEPAADMRIGTRTVDDCETHCPAGKSSLGPQTSMETSPAPRSETLQGRTARWTTSLVLETWSERSKKTNQRFLAPGCSNQQHVDHSWIAYRGFLWSSVHDPRYDRLLKTTRQPMNT